jgi:hypothetical protein
MKKERIESMMKQLSRATMLGVPGDAARRRGLQNIIVPFVLLSFVMGLALGTMILMPFEVSLLILATTIVVGLGFYWSIPQRGYSYFKGARGEEMTASELAHLPAQWTIFNGLILPDGRDIDHVAVGPQGIFVIETKHWSGSVEIVKDQLLANGRTLPGERSPMLQVRRAVSSLAETLGVEQRLLQGMICFAGTQFVNGIQFLDEIVFCSYLHLETFLREKAVCLDDTALARVVATLNTLTITEGL